ncbi:hypothetical protein [Anaeromyxobacter diazotrophicus]|uniref:Tetratricopeptide repeat protein n=1 Tax=Anaeromyxobacter diazotrophicus TaxID=2590199 RepID=A0A7I9VRR8_9BACT|nr:hypothetical protein [Anaeromyxobacter diazotrophicus]GEJ59123.1 hypothetical protein AMYX_38640 [Anaeromyxobacter diazotrophicus]
MTGLLLALALAAADPCAPPPPPAGAPDPAAASAYREVGDAERQAGARETAALAYREALARDPGDQASRSALDALCREGTAAAPLQRGLRALEAGELREAARAFAEARAAGAGASAALLEGVALYELGEDDRARDALAAAREDPAHRDVALLYLGLLALRAGDAEAAAAELDAASQDPEVSALAAPLARLARRSGRLVVSALVSSGWDSNAQLAPSGTPIDTSSDGQVDVAAGALYRPLGPSGPYLAARGLFHQQLRFTELDAWGLAGAAGWQLGGTARGLAAEYGYTYRTLDGSPFLSAHGPRAAGWTSAGPLTLAASYTLRLESYQGALYQPFSGAFQTAEASASVQLARWARALAGYRVARDATDLSQLSFVEHGPRVELRLDAAPALRVVLGAALAWRGYDALDPQLGLTRADTSLGGGAALEWELTARLFLQASLEARQVWSNASAFAYLRVAPAVGLGWVGGL